MSRCILSNGARKSSRRRMLREIVSAHSMRNPTSARSARRDWRLWMGAASTHRAARRAGPITIPTVPPTMDQPSSLRRHPSPPPASQSPSGSRQAIPAKLIVRPSTTLRMEPSRKAPLASGRVQPRLPKCNWESTARQTDTGFLNGGSVRSRHSPPAQICDTRSRSTMPMPPAASHGPTMISASCRTWKPSLK